ncbi:MAG: spore germination protein [Clostridia bacterium]|nr:spore germination protein [Clostridia bacterium]
MSASKKTNLQLFFTMFSFLFVINTYLSDAEGVAEHAAWVSSIIALFEGLLIIFIFSKLAVQFPGKTLNTINDALFGKVIGKVITVLYASYFLQISVNVSQYLSSFTHTIMLLNTPKEITIILIWIVVYYTLLKGIKTIFHLSFIFFSIALIYFFSSNLLLIGQFDFEYLFPISTIPIKDIFHAAHMIGTYYGESLCFLALIPLAKKDKISKTLKYVMLAVLLSGISIIINQITNIAVLGDLSSIYKHTTFQSIRLVNVGDVILRVDALIYIETVMIVFLQIVLPFYAFMICLSQLLNIKDYKTILLPITVLSIALTIRALNMNDSDVTLFYEQIYIFYTIPFQIILPLASLVIFYVKKKFKKEENI